MSNFDKKAKREKLTKDFKRGMTRDESARFNRKRPFTPTHYDGVVMTFQEAVEAQNLADQKGDKFQGSKCNYHIAATYQNLLIDCLNFSRNIEDREIVLEAAKKAKNDYQKALDIYEQKGMTALATEARDGIKYEEDFIQAVRHDGAKQRLASRKGLDSRVLNSTLSTIVVLAGLFFLSSNITGNVIGLNQTSSNWIGVGLFVVGLLGAFVYFRKR